MENRIPIDELFHDKLSQGTEQMNLGAWANMERMLDGKNPYAKEEEKKRRGLFPLFFLFFLGLGIVGASYYMYNRESTPTHVANNEKSNTSNSFKSIAEQELNQSNETHSSNEVVNNASNSTNSNDENLVSNSNPVQPSTSNLTKNNISSVQHSSSLNSIQNSGLDNPTKTNSNRKKIHQKISAVNKPSNLLTQQYLDNQQNSDQDLSLSDLKPKKRTKASTKAGSPTEFKSNSTDQSSLSKSTENKIKEVTQIPAVTIAKRELRKRDGSVEAVIGDTIGTSVYEKVTEKSSPEVVTASLDPMVTNPRYKVLNAEEEKNARYKQSESTQQEQPAIIASAVQPSEANKEMHSEISINSNQQKKAVHNTGYFEDLKKFFTDTYTKVSNFVLYSPKPNWYTGLNMGVNMSLSNSQHNFGGFQGGFTALTPINDYFSFITECKFYYRNNGGYTANDISYNIINQQEDTQSIIHNTIYSYTKDSTVKTYNFKNFYSLEMPLMVQLNSRSFAFYGGVNLAYGFKLKTLDKTRNYKVDYVDTVQSTMPYSFPSEKGSIIAREDFSSRFGIGYTIGAGYSFSPQLYLDLRVTQNVWDNMKTNAAREISSGYFKVPTIQFGLGYRFRKFTPDN